MAPQFVWRKWLQSALLIEAVRLRLCFASDGGVHLALGTHYGRAGFHDVREDNESECLQICSFFKVAPLCPLIGFEPCGVRLH